MNKIKHTNLKSKKSNQEKSIPQCFLNVYHPLKSPVPQVFTFREWILPTTPHIFKKLHLHFIRIVCTFPMLQMLMYCRTPRFPVFRITFVEPHRSFPRILPHTLTSNTVDSRIVTLSITVNTVLLFRDRTYYRSLVTTNIIGTNHAIANRLSIIAPVKVG